MNIEEVLFYSFRRISKPKSLMALELYYTNILIKDFLVLSPSSNG